MDDEDRTRIMHPDRQQGFLDALTDLCRQWGIRIKDMQTCEAVVLTPIEGSYRSKDGRYFFTREGRITWDDMSDSDLAHSSAGE